MKSSTLSFSIRLAFAVTSFATITASPTGLRAATGSSETGVKLLEAQLPGGTNLSQATCEPLARAVGRATLAHRANATAILSAALTAGGNPGHTAAKRTCTCVVHIFRISIAAAPTQASRLLETATALCPACAEELIAALDRAGDKDARDEKDAPGGTRSDAFDPTVRGTGDMNTADSSVNGDLSDRDTAGLGFGSGFGPGFPGSPGFTGSAPSGGLALPFPTAVTSVVNG